MTSTIDFYGSGSGLKWSNPLNEIEGDTVVIVGVVAEYNPFHWGHLYHLNRIKSDLNPHAIICVMSGNFVQRGEPAIFDKWARAEMALHQGADLVFELPVCFSTSTAEIFAHSAITLLHQTGVVNYLSFGVEENCMDILVPLGEILAHEPAELKKLLKAHLDKGVTFAVARERAVLEYLARRGFATDLTPLARLLKKPNFILALEYQKAIHRLQADIKIHPILRHGAQYHDTDIKGKFSSATALRVALRQDINIHSISNSIPKTTLDIMLREIDLQRGPVFFQHFEELFLYALRRLTPEEMLKYFDVGEGLEHRIIRASREITLDRLI